MVLVLQELKVAGTHNFSLKGFNVHKKCCLGLGGGVCLAVRNSIPSRPLPIQTQLEAVACTVYFQGISINICTVYFNEQADVSLDTLAELLSEIPSPRIFLGDMNAKHVAWGSPYCNSRGRLLMDIFSESGLFVLNDGSPTYYDAHRDYYSHLDLPCVSDEISHKFHWSVYPDQLSSDHFPLLLSYDFDEIYSTKLPTWQLGKANWDLFRSVLRFPDECRNLEQVPQLHQNVVNDLMFRSIQEASATAIPKSSANYNPQYSCYWWDDECQSDLYNARREFRLLRRQHTMAGAVHCRMLEAKATRTVLNCKRDSWRGYMSTINRSTSVSQIWRVIKTLNGKPSSFGKILLNVNGEVISDPGELVKIFVNYFASISSDDNYSWDFLLHKIEVELEPLHFPDGDDSYNRPFTLQELRSALEACEDTSPGADGIHYAMLKNMSDLQLGLLLNFYNYLWLNDLFPDAWREAVVLPFVKPGKAPGCVASFRPIQLTSCLCKLLERMVHNRFACILDTLDFISPYQSGFRKHHSTYDPLVRSEGAIQEAFICGEYLVAVFLDIAKAYDMVWVRQVLKILQDLGLKGHLPRFISNFLKDRKIKVRIGDIFSDLVKLQNGLPQGSVLSPLLFLILINSIFGECEEVSLSLFCDDGKFWATGSTLEEAVGKVQRALDCISSWCDTNGRQLSPGKTNFVVFTRRKVHFDSVLTYNGSPLHRSRKIKYLGLIFDCRLTWKAHITDLVARCQQPLSVMRKVAGHDWGGDRASLRLLYFALDRSKIDYGCFLYGTACATNLGKLDRVQYAALHIITGNMKCTPTLTLEAEAHVMPLRFRRQQLALQYFGNRYRISDHIIHGLYDSFHAFQFYRDRPYPLPVVGRCQDMADEAGLQFEDLEQFRIKDLHYSNDADVRLFI